MSAVSRRYGRILGKGRRTDDLMGIELMRSDDGDVQMRILEDWKIGRLEDLRRKGSRAQEKEAGARKKIAAVLAGKRVFG